ncbi:conserved hypothetical protein [Candidatus Terasakiella magnetica]|nr:conserved hypothetical protein [Candidatus Terasakiella magnetica]
MTDSDIPPEERAGFEEFAAKVDGTNISSQTLLATDYLNHFNEIVMLLDMVPDMPDMIEECKFWQPKSYPEHFADSSFKDKLLAIEAYERVPTKFRRPFEETLNQLNTLILGGVNKLEEEIVAGADPGLVTEHVKAISRAAQALMDCANAIIHGSDRAMAQLEIDGLLG